MVVIQFCPVISDIPVGIIIILCRGFYLWRLKNGMISSHCGIPKVGDTGAYAWDHKNCLLYGVARCLLYGRTFRIVHYEVVEGCACCNVYCLLVILCSSVGYSGI